MGMRAVIAAVVPRMATKVRNLITSSLTLVNGPAPATPGTGKTTIFADATGVPHYVNDAGVDNELATAEALAASTGASLVGFQQSGTGAVARTAQDKARETVTDADFDTPANAAAAAAALAQFPYNVISGDKGDKYRALAGVIRNSGSGWAFISDSSHRSVGMGGTVEPISGEPHKLRVTYTFNGASAGTFIAAPDETFAARGVLIGASVATNEAILQASMNLRFRTYGVTAVADFSPYFGTRVSIAAKADGTGFVATVPTMASGLNLPQVTIRATDARSLPVRVNHIGSTSFEVVAFKQLAGRVRYTGSAWAIDSDNVCNLAATFNTGTGELTITHTATGTTDYAVFVARIDGMLEPRVVGGTGTSIIIKFYDDAGALVTTPSSLMKCYFSRAHEFPAIMPATQHCYIDCGRCFLNWSDISDGNANVWLHGMMRL